MSTRNEGLIADPVFVGATRPAMRWGVTYVAMLLNGIGTMMVFLLSKNLLTLLIAVPVHGVCALLCARDAMYFDLVLLSARTRLLGYLGNARFWRGCSYSPLSIDAPRTAGLRAYVPVARIAHRRGERC